MKFLNLFHSFDLVAHWFFLFWWRKRRVWSIRIFWLFSWKRISLFSPTRGAIWNFLRSSRNKRRVVREEIFSLKARRWRGIHAAAGEGRGGTNLTQVRAPSFFSSRMKEKKREIWRTGKQQKSFLTTTKKLTRGHKKHCWRHPQFYSHQIFLIQKNTNRFFSRIWIMTRKSFLFRIKYKFCRQASFEKKCKQFDFWHLINGRFYVQMEAKLYQAFLDIFGKTWNQIRQK